MASSPPARGDPGLLALEGLRLDGPERRNLRFSALLAWRDCRLCRRGIRRIVKHPLRRQRLTVMRHDGTLETLAHISRPTFDDAPVIVDLDLSFRDDAAPRLDATGLALRDESLARLRGDREGQENQAKSIGRRFHDRAFRAGNSEDAEGPISAHFKLGTTTKWYDPHKENVTVNREEF